MMVVMNVHFSQSLWCLFAYKVKCCSHLMLLLIYWYFFVIISLSNPAILYV